MSDIESAKALLRENGYTCVLIREGQVYTSSKSGIAPMLEFIECGMDLAGFSAADRVIGKAAAMLFVLAGVTQLYGEVMSAGAVSILEQYPIVFSYGSLTEKIINRDGTDICPMEKTVLDISEPSVAPALLRSTLDKLSAAKK